VALPMLKRLLDLHRRLARVFGKVFLAQAQIRPQPIESLFAPFSPLHGVHLGGISSLAGCRQRGNASSLIAPSTSVLEQFWLGGECLQVKSCRGPVKLFENANLSKLHALASVGRFADAPEDSWEFFVELDQTLAIANPLTGRIGPL